jgi:hypothetical protein
MVICLQIPTILWIGGRTTSLSYWMSQGCRQIEIQTAEPLLSDPSPFEVEIAIAKLSRFKSPGSDQIPAELIQAGGEILRSKIHKLINLFGIKKNCSSSPSRRDSNSTRTPKNRTNKGKPAPDPKTQTSRPASLPSRATASLQSLHRHI